MKKLSLSLSIVAVVSLTVSLSSCADKMTDRHSEMKGGEQGTLGGNPIHDSLGLPEHSNGMGQPIAGGKINSARDSMWNENSPLEQKAF